MKPREQFEIRCYKYLKNSHKTKETDFYHEGGMNSTKSDIAVIKNGTIDFYIEAKDTLAQSGQFVLLPDKDKEIFIFSPRNRSEPNKMTDIIIDYMNHDFNHFYNAGTTGKQLNMNAGTFADWIIEHYTNKNVKYIISFDTNYVIFPIRKFAQYFRIIANYRIKKSGSGTPAKKEILSVKQTIQKYYHTAEFHEEKNRLFVNISEKVHVDKFILGNYTYYLAQKGSGEYQVRKLSNTYNMNVIFSIKLIKPQDENDLAEFKSDL